MFFEAEDIVKCSGVFLLAKDRHSRFIYCNENFSQGLGLSSPKQIIGKTDYEFFEDSVAKTYQAGDAHVLRGGVFVNIREVHPQVGKTIQILTTKNQLRNKHGDLMGVVVSFMDVTHLDCTVAEDLLDFNAQKRVYEFEIGDQKEYFTPREYSVFKFILKGYTAKQIAAHLGLSYRTVEDYVFKIKMKLQCDSKYHISEAAMRFGLVQQNIKLFK